MGTCVVSVNDFPEQNLLNTLLLLYCSCHPLHKAAQRMLRRPPQIVTRVLYYCTFFCFNITFSSSADDDNDDDFHYYGGAAFVPRLSHGAAWRRRCFLPHSHFLTRRFVVRRGDIIGAFRLHRFWSCDYCTVLYG